ncbi:alpha/beta hydrolase [Desmospora profundinema]|uniref:Alpha-beta hydrolase superfamily lysophospholipase n=1 Tax=Desmospora profundinema TaxID=1571184 RepID=A0ABU1IJR5_9BACL|nr:alpha/beta hydrolase [Desmospora profundinema]MDR6224234.1 alpha-beta hydrolase superfamily lysophospholipase [Desmospora profundinema]
MSHCHTYEDRLRMRDGTCLHYRIWVPERFHSAVILVHGAGEHLELYKHLGNRFSHAGHAFIIFDLRGFGRSDGKSGHVTCFDDYLEDMNQLIHFFRHKLGDIQVYLIGHSLGGLIVTRYAQSYPDTINGMVLSAPALGLHIKIPTPIYRLIQFISRVTPGLSVNPYRLMEKAQRISRLKRYISYDVNTKLSDPLVALRYSIRWVQELLVHINIAISKSEHVRVPTLCLCGDHDPLISPHAVRTFFDRLTVKEKEWRLLPGAGHCLLHSNESTPAVDALMEWLQQSK